MANKKTYEEKAAHLEECGYVVREFRAFLKEEAPDFYHSRRELIHSLTALIHAGDAQRKYLTYLHNKQTEAANALEEQPYDWNSLLADMPMDNISLCDNELSEQI